MILILLLKVVDLFFEERLPDFQLYERQLILTEHPPNADYSVVPPDFRMREAQNLEQKEYRLRTDEYGFIIGPSDVGFFEESIDIIFFGGSTTECFFVDEDKRYPYLVGKTLEKELGERVSVRNAGLMGKHSMKSNFDLMVRGTRLKPQVVVLMHNINDLVQLLYVNGYYDGPLTRRLIADHNAGKNERGWVYKTAYSIKEWVFPNIYRVISEGLRKEPNSFDEWEGWRANQDIRAISLKEQFVKSLLTFISIAKSNGFEVVLMTQFNRMDVDDEFIVGNYYLNAQYGIPHDLFFDYYHLFNNAIRETAEKENVLLIDLANHVPSSSEYLYDAVHLNTNGSILTAEIISDSLLTKFFNSSIGFTVN